MAVIPRHIYRRVEGALHRRCGAVEGAAERYRQAQEKAMRLGQRMDGAPGGPQRSDRTGRDAADLGEAGERLETAERWEQVFRRLDAMFEGRDEAKAAKLLYDEHRSQEEVARMLYVERQTVRRWRDAYVCHAALLAAEAGLIRMEDEICGGD